ncbi:hypothetical protein PEKONANI_03213 [Aeromonas jandaei]
MEQAKRIEPIIEQGQRVVWRARDKLLRQPHLVNGTHSLKQQMAGELCLAKHAHLRIGSLAMLELGKGLLGNKTR